MLQDDGDVRMTGVAIQAEQRKASEWRAEFERCVRACGQALTSELWERALPLRRAGTSPFAAVAELGVTPP